MSGTAKGHIKVIGAGVMGFIAAVGVAGLVLTYGSGRGASFARAAAPAPAAAALDSVIARPTLSRDLPASSPAPIVGSAAGETPGYGAASGASRGPAAGQPVLAAVVAPAAGLGAMGAARYGGDADSTTSAWAEAGKPATSKRKEPAAVAPALKPVPRVALDKSGARGSIASAVHYGVTSRSELMGKAAGPVYNFAGRQVAGGQGIAQLSSQAGRQVAEVERSIEASDALTPEQKARMLSKLRQADLSAPPSNQ